MKVFSSAVYDDSSIFMFMQHFQIIASSLHGVHFSSTQVLKFSC